GAAATGAIISYGRVRVSAGSLTADVGGGLTLRNDGVVQVEGGVLTSRVISTIGTGVGAVGSYIQSGGNVLLTGGGATAIQADYAVFSLTYPGNVFNMSGGTLTIQNRTATGTGGLRGAVFINSNPGNVSVTGGTVIMDANTAINYRITSRVPFWNVILRASGGARTLDLSGTTSGTGGGLAEPSLAIQPLVVLNDFTIEGAAPNNATFTTNNANVTVSGNFEIQNGGIYTHGTNTTTISGLGVSSLIFRNTATTPTFHNFTINKTNATDEVVIATGRLGPTDAALQINGIFNVERGVFDYSSFVASAQGAVTFSDNITVGKRASTGRLMLNGAVAQTINSSSRVNIHNLDINNSSNVTLATNNLTVRKKLTLTLGNFNIDRFRLTLDGDSARIEGSGFSATKMIQTAGNTSDGGLELYLDANETLVYPIGVASKYTPVTATFTSFADDGLIRINPVNGVLRTTATGSADILNYYWRVGASNFTVRPLVSYLFTYIQSDAGGTETNYVSGKVLDNAPFTRSHENDPAKVDEATNIITFNGSGAGFTLEEANYTAGASARFVGTPEVYYTRVSGDGSGLSWTTPANWTLATNNTLPNHHPSQPAATDYPRQGDIAVIGFVPFVTPALPNQGRPHGIAINAGVTVDIAELRFEQMRDASNNPTARNHLNHFQFWPTVVIERISATGQGELINAKVSGQGTFWITGQASNPTFAGIDLGDFNLQDSSYVIYQTSADVTYSNTPTTFPNLMLSGSGWGSGTNTMIFSSDITVNGNLELLGNARLVLSDGATGNITVRRNLRFFSLTLNGNNSDNQSTFLFQHSGTARTVTVFGNFIMGIPGQAMRSRMAILSAGAAPIITHTFNLHGNFTQQIQAGGLGFRGTEEPLRPTRIHLNLLGSNSMTFTANGGDTFVPLWSLTIDKGTSISTTAQFNSPIRVVRPSNGAIKPFTLVNGLCVINHASTNLVLTSGGGDFNIPASAGLEVRAGTVRTDLTSAGANITLDGLLRVSGGTVTIDAGPFSGATDTNYIQYSNSGMAAIEVTNGSLTVAGHIRRDLASTTGVLRYTQSGGTVLVGAE
ncbi:MAG: hypothetical protein ORN54_05535, partial [Cyclobacteriaceae bacterium]|nr:hypothetical protein [Cyclobacteriaceae bacterium]